jgi:hypothetical protein
MTPTTKRTLSGPYIMKWVTFMVVVVVGLAFLRGLQAQREAGGIEVRPKPPVTETVAPTPPPVAPVEVKPKTRRSQSPEPKLGQVAAPASEEPVRAPAVVPVSEPQLGVQEEAPQAKPWVEPQDVTYVGKVVPCEGQKYDQSTVMGGDGSLNFFYLCLDVGSAFTKIRGDNLFNPVMFWYKNQQYRAAQLRKNDVVRVTVNDGQVLKVEMVRSVKE